MFCSRSFVVSALRVRFKIPFQFVFVCGLEECFNFIFLCVATQFFQHDY